MRALYCCAAVVAVAIVLRAGTAYADRVVLLNDDFNVTQSSTDVNWQLTARQTGVLAPVTYLQSVDTLSTYHEVVAPAGYLQLASDAAGEGAVAPNLDFHFGGVEDIQFDVTPLSAPSDARAGITSWAAVTFGQSRSDGLSFIAVSDGLGLLFRANGEFEAYSAGKDLGSARYASSPAGRHHINIRISTADDRTFDGTPATIRAYVDGSTTPFFSFTRAAGFSSNYVEFSVDSDLGAGGTIYYAAHQFDNLQIATTVPPGDADLDGSVQFSDLVTLARHFGMEGGNWLDGDFNGDGKVTFADLVILAAHYGSSTPIGIPVTTVPEPATVMLLISLVSLPRRRGS